MLHLNGWFQRGLSTPLSDNPENHSFPIEVQTFIIFSLNSLILLIGRLYLHCMQVQNNLG